MNESPKKGKSVTLVWKNGDAPIWAFPPSTVDDPLTSDWGTDA